jgi:type VI protein secretion system component VasF
MEKRRTLEDPTKVARRRRKRLVRQVAWLFLAAVLVAVAIALAFWSGAPGFIEY